MVKMVSLVAATVTVAGLFGVASARAAEPPSRFLLGDVTEAPLRGPLVLRAYRASVNEGLLALLCGSERVLPLTVPLVELPGSVTLVAGVTSVVRDGADLALNGEVPGTNGTQIVIRAASVCDAPAGSALLTGTLLVNGDHYTIRPDGPGRVVFSQIDDDRASAHTDEEDLQKKPAARRFAPRRGKPVPPRGRAGKGAACDQPDGFHVIDFLVVYSTAAKNFMGGDAAMLAALEQKMAETNKTFTDSAIPARVRLVHAEEVPGYTGNDGLSDVGRSPLRSLTYGSEGMAGVDALRARYGVDEVAFIAQEGTGSAWFPQPPNTDKTDGNLAIGATYLDGTNFTHEVGHTLGSSHDWKTDPDFRGADYYRPAHGYVAPSRNWYTIMGYSSACRPGACAHLLRFSDAHATYQGEALGTLDAAKPADNVPLMRKYGVPAVAAYRESVSGPMPMCVLAQAVSPANAGGVEASIAGPYDPGTSLTVHALPADGYVFQGWNLDGADAGNADTLPITMNTDRTITARFVRGVTPTHPITTTAVPAEGGAVTLDPPGTDQPEGSTVIARARPNDGYTFAGWTIDGNDGGTVDRLEVTVDGPHRLTAAFTKNPVTPTTSPTPTPAAKLTLSSRADRPSITAGSKARYSFTVTNTGTATARSLTARLHLPAGLRDLRLTVMGPSRRRVAAAPRCTRTGRTATCPLGDLPAATTITVQATGTTGPATHGTLTTRATLTAPGSPTLTAALSVSVRRIPPRACRQPTRTPDLAC